MATQTYLRTLEVQTCCKCGMCFGVEKTHDEMLRRTKKTFYCPSGHPQHYLGKSFDEQKRELEQQVQRERQRRDQESAAHRDERDHLSAQVRGQKAAKTRLKNRIAAGVCPCCNRSFTNLRRHMEGQHPEYTAATGDSE